MAVGPAVGAGRWGFAFDMTYSGAAVDVPSAVVTLADGTVAALQESTTANGVTTATYLAADPLATAAGQPLAVSVSIGGQTQSAGTVVSPTPPTTTASPATAAPLGSVAPGQPAAAFGSVSPTAAGGSYYLLKAARATAVAVTTSAGSAVRVDLLTKAGRVVATSAGTAGLHAKLSPRTTYYVRVTPALGSTATATATAYQLSVNPTYPTPAAARAVGKVGPGSPQVLADVLSAAAPQAYYKLTAKATGPLSAGIAGLSTPVVVQWLDGRGRVLASTTVAGDAGTATLPAAKAGKAYFVRVATVDPATATAYTLTLSA